MSAAAAFPLVADRRAGGFSRRRALQPALAVFGRRCPARARYNSRLSARETVFSRLSRRSWRHGEHSDVRAARSDFLTASGRDTARLRGGRGGGLERRVTGRRRGRGRGRRWRGHAVEAVRRAALGIPPARSAAAAVPDTRAVRGRGPSAGGLPGTEGGPFARRFACP